MEDVPTWYSRLARELPREVVETVLTQAGTVSNGQITRFVQRGTVRSKVAAGLWQHVHRGVYAVFAGPLDDEARDWAALLRCGTGATLSHRTAARLHGFGDDDGSDQDVDVTIPAPRRVCGEYHGIRVHHAHRIDATRHPAISPPRTRVEATVLDLVDVARSERQAAGWILAACQRRLTTPGRLAEHLVERKKIRWRPMAEAMLVSASEGVQSLLEQRFMTAVERAHGLPGAQRQRRVAGARVIWVDADYESYDVRVELDGRLGHNGDGSFRDRRRDNRGVVDGKATLRYGFPEVFGESCLIAGELGGVLVARGWSGAPRRCGQGCSLVSP